MQQVNSSIITLCYQDNDRFYCKLKQRRQKAINAGLMVIFEFQLV